MIVSSKIVAVEIERKQNLMTAVIRKETRGKKKERENAELGNSVSKGKVGGIC